MFSFLKLTKISLYYKLFYIRWFYMKQKLRKPKLAASTVSAKTHGTCLHPELKKYLGYCFFKSAINYRSTVDGKLQPFGLVGPQFGMLIILKEGGAITQGELGLYVAVDKATMVRMIDGLEEKKYVTRIPSKTDRRANHLEITSAGRKVLVKLDEVRRHAEKEFFAPLTDREREHLRIIIGKLISEASLKS